MENTSVANVTASKPKVGGAIFYAPVDTALPTDAKSALDEAFISLGYVSEDGLKNESDSGSTTKAWGGDIVLISGGGDSFSCTLIETLRESVLKLIHGDDNVSGTIDTGIKVDVGDRDIQNYAFVIDMVLRDGILKRVVIPKACVSEVGEVTYSDEDAVGYEVTLTAQKDETEKYHHEYLIKKGA